MPNYRILGIAASETSSAKVCQNAVFPNCVLKTRHNLRIRTHAYPPLGNQPSRRQLLRLEPERQSVTAVDGSRAAPVVAAAMGGRTWSPTRRTWSRSSPDRRAPCRRASGCRARRTRRFGVGRLTTPSNIDFCTENRVRQCRGSTQKERAAATSASFAMRRTTAVPACQPLRCVGTSSVDQC
jgi:hypothetical protein